MCFYTIHYIVVVYLKISNTEYMYSNTIQFTRYRNEKITDTVEREKGVSFLSNSFQFISGKSDLK